MHLIGQSMVKVAIGLLLLFFINLFGGWIGLHVPINLFTVIVSGFLGLFGIVSLTAIHLLILS